MCKILNPSYWFCGCPLTTPHPYERKCEKATRRPHPKPCAVKEDTQVDYIPMACARCDPKYMSGLEEQWSTEWEVNMGKIPPSRWEQYEGLVGHRLQRAQEEWEALKARFPERAHRHEMGYDTLALRQLEIIRAQWRLVEEGMRKADRGEGNGGSGKGKGKGKEKAGR